MEQSASYNAYMISIHALLAESDEHANNSANANLYFYPRSPCGERLEGVDSMLTLIQFLSTLSLRRATARAKSGQQRSRFLSTLSLRRATSGTFRSTHRTSISIHALLAESDVVDTLIFAGSMLFLSTLSLRRATACVFARSVGAPISIHALLAESDETS